MIALHQIQNTLTMTNANPNSKNIECTQDCLPQKRHMDKIK